MKNAEKEYSIRIFTGAHAGTDLPLHSGEYRIGASDDCDIILEDCRDDEQAVRLILENDRIVVHRESGACFINGESLNGEEKVVEDFSTLTLGTAHLAVGPAEEEWPPFQIPEIKTASPVEQSAEIQDAADDVRTGSPDQQISERVDGVVVRWRKMLLVAAAVIFVLLMLNFNISYEQQEDVIAMAPEQVKQELETMLKTMPVKKASVDIGDNGELAVSGMLRHRIEEEKIIPRIAELPYQTVVRFNAADELLPVFQTVLDNYNLNLHVRYSEAGDFVLHGFARDEALVRQIVTRLQNDLPAVGPLKVSVQTHETLIPEIFEEIDQQGGIKGRIELQAHADYIRAAGELFPEDRVAWATARQKIVQRYGPHIRFQERFTTQPLTITKKKNAPTKVPPNPAWELKRMIAGLTYGATPYIRTNTGAKIFEGASVGNAFIVKRILPDRVIFDKSGKTITIPVP